ncbi:MAG: diacylglycerol kinase family lipid kinase [bacterium]|nr:diacylglycerol kinase family lipid kinase [bacterium]
MDLKNIFKFLFKGKKPIFQSAYIIINPAAGKQQIKWFLKSAKSFLNRLNIRYDYALTRAPRHATKLAQEAVKKKYDIIFAAGGDGTINEVINGIVDYGGILGIIPLGTVNILAMEMGIPLNPVRSLNILLEGQIETIDLGKSNNQYFVLMSACGIDSYTIYRVNLKLKKYIGPFAYIFAGLYSLFKYKPKKIIIDIDNHRIDEIGYYVVVENISAYGGKLKMTPYAQYNDGLLDVCIFKRYGLWDVFRYFIGIALAKHIEYPDVIYYQCKQIKMHSQENVLLHTDGELVGSLPVSISAVKKKLKILVPRPLNK